MTPFFFLSLMMTLFGMISQSGGVDLGRVNSRHRRDISVDGLKAKDELAYTDRHSSEYKKFKNSVFDHIPSKWMRKDIVLAKFFKMNGRDSQKSKAAVMEVMRWRKANKIEDIAKEDLSRGIEMFEANTNEVDLQGRVILYMQCGKWALAPLLSSVHDTPKNKPGDDKIYERTFYKLFDEASMKVVENYDTKFTKNAQHVMIVNYAEWETKDGACVDCVTLVSRLGINYETQWPEFGHKVILVNTADDFGIFFDLIRLVLSKETNEKLVTFDRNKEKWMPELKTIISEDVINKLIK
jgi:hypothetical protein